MSCMVRPGARYPAPLPDLAISPEEHVFRGLVERGHGFEAISAFLRIDQERVSEWIARFGLVTPHHRPMRHSKSPRAWPPEDYYRFIECWTAGWHAASIGQRFGRSA